MACLPFAGGGSAGGAASGPAGRPGLRAGRGAACVSLPPRRPTWADPNAFMSNEEFARTRYCRACWNGTGIAMNRASRIADFTFSHIYLHNVVCLHLHIAYFNIPLQILACHSGL